MLSLHVCLPDDDCMHVLTNDMLSILRTGRWACLQQQPLQMLLCPKGTNLPVEKHSNNNSNRTDSIDDRKRGRDEAFGVSVPDCVGVAASKATPRTPVDLCAYE